MIPVKEYIQQFFVYDESTPMLFTQLSFWIFFLLVLSGYSFFYKKNTLRSAWLFLTSLFFYYLSSGFFFFLLIFSTCVDFFIGKKIAAAERSPIKKSWLLLSITVNLVLLAYFKYTFFFVDVLNELHFLDIPRYNYLAAGMNQLLQTDLTVKTIFLPVGISFFTFQTISYAVDVYRGDVKPVHNLIDFGFYVSFFPQLVAGPIVRAAQFIPQLYRPYSVSRAQFGHALFLILSGLIKKVLISDYISINFVDRVFHAPDLYSGFENLLAVYGYSVQIYCDFSGYTDMAIGVALLLGFRLPPNFFAPYKADSLSDFWRRWHISLSSWLRDYLYIPLGGSRKGRIRTSMNLLITMVLGGLWHGASLRFMIWGALHGVGLLLHKYYARLVPWSGSDNRWLRFVHIVFTFHFVSFAWIFFRASDFSQAWLMINTLVTDIAWTQIPAVLVGYRYPFLLIFWALVLHYLPAQFKEECRGLFIRTPIWVKALLFVVVAVMLYQIRSAEVQPFIYFRF